MALYLIGDIQGCDSILERLLNEIDFSPSKDIIFLLGDLVNRGPASAKVLRRLMHYGPAANCILGNHDMHLLAVAAGQGKINRNDTFQDVLDAPDRSILLDWLRQQPLACRYQDKINQDVLMVHAGVLPSWSAQKTLSLAEEVHTVLRGPDVNNFLNEMYSDLPDTWSDDLKGTARLRVIVNVLTRLRFCDEKDRMEFVTKSGVNKTPEGFKPWFDVPNRQTASQTIAFGHWSTLGWLDRHDVICMDTGCAWGGTLSALPLNALNCIADLHKKIISVPGQPNETPYAN